jgi:tetratricopeptide (TPR) repeat protein
MPFGKLFKRNKPKAAPPPPAAPEPKIISPWEAQNQDAINQLARFIDFAEGFTLGFIEINFVKDLDELLKTLRKRPECSSTEFVVFDLSDPNLKYLKDELLGRIAQLPPPLSSLVTPKRVIVVKGLENAIGMFGDYPPVLQDLNFVRDAFIESVPYPVLFCLPSYAINRVIQFAPDFWSWKSGIFRVKGTQASEDNASIRGLHADKLMGSLNQLERQERIELLERLAQEFSPLEGFSNKDDLRVGVKALTELGILHIFAGEYKKASPALEKAAQLLDKPEWQPENDQDLAARINYLNWHGCLEFQIGNTAQAETVLQSALLLNKSISLDQKGLTCFHLGRLKAQQGQVDDAIALYTESLEIFERIGDAQGKAASLHQLGQLKAQQGQIDDAIALYTESLAIKERIGDAQGKAASLHALGNLKAQQGQIDDAIALFTESLEILERIGNVQGKATSLHALGILKAQQGQIDDAIALYTESLEIKERIGDAHGKAASLHALGILKAQQGQIDDAIALYTESLEIKERIGDAHGKAASLHALGILKAQQGQIDDAIALYTESLEIKERIGDAQGKAASLHALGYLKAQQGQIDDAIALYTESLAIFERIGNAQGKAASLRELGSIKIKQGDLEDANVLLKEALSIQERIGAVISKAITLCELSKLKAKYGELDEAISLVTEALGIAERIGYAEEQANAKSLLGELFMQKGNFDAAVPYLKEAFTIFQSIRSPKAKEVQTKLHQVHNPEPENH